MEDDKLRAVLRAWEAPEPNPEMDARVRAAWRASHPPRWNRAHAVYDSATFSAEMISRLCFHMRADGR